VHITSEHIFKVKSKKVKGKSENQKASNFIIVYKKERQKSGIESKLLPFYFLLTPSRYGRVVQSE